MSKRIKITLIVCAFFLLLSSLAAYGITRFGKSAAAFELSGEFSGEYGEEERIILPAAEVRSEGGYGIIIEKDGVIIDVFEGVDGEISYTLGKKGVYCVKYFYRINGNLSNCSYTFTVAEKPVINEISLPEYFAPGQRVEIKEVFALYLGEKHAVVPVITAPDGSEAFISDGVFTPEQMGEYKFQYSFTAEGKSVSAVRNVICAVTPSSLLLTLDDFTTLTDNTALPAYSVEGNGVKVIGLGSSSGIEYKHDIDLSALGKDDNLFALQTYVGEDVNPFRAMYVTLTDALNPKTELKIKYERVARFSSNSRVSVNYNGNWLGICNESYKTDFYNKVWVNRFGTLLDKSSFYPDSNVNNGLFALKFDYEEQQLLVKKDLNNYDLLLDLDEKDRLLEDGRTLEDCMFTGFASPLVRLKIAFEYVEDKAGVIITEIAGQSLSGKVCTDGAAPVITTNTPKNIPCGVVGSPYKIFGASALDNVCGETEVSVALKKSGADCSYLIRDGAFTPNETGNYELVYSSADIFGTRSEKRIPFKVISRAEYEAEPVVLEFVTPPSEAIIGAKDKYYIPETKISGGTRGGYSCETEIRYGGQTLELDDTRKIRLSHSGDILITANITDYTGEPVQKTLTIPVEVPLKTVVEVAPAPSAVLSGTEIILPDFTAVDYGSPEVKPSAKITVNGKEVSVAERRYAVTEKAGEKLEVKYICGTYPKQTTETIIIDVIGASDTFENYFVYDRTAISAAIDEKALVFSSNENMQITSPFPIAAGDISFRFKIDGAANAFGWFDIILTDYENADVSVKVSIYKDGSGAFMTVNGGAKRYPVKGSFSGDEIFFGMDGNEIVSEDGKRITAVTRTEEGGVFNGFASLKVRAAFKTSGTTAKSGLGIVQISNQTFNKYVAKGDKNPPVICFFSPFAGGRVGIDSVITVPAAVACDVLSGNCSVYLDVVAPDKNTVLKRASCNVENTVKLQSYGRYTFNFTIRDGNGNQTVHKVNVDVADEIPPEITVDAGLKTNYSAGDKITVPSASVKDNHFENLEVSVVVQLPSGKYAAVNAGEEFLLEQRGGYKLVYFSFDGDYNLARTEFAFTVD